MKKTILSFIILLLSNFLFAQENYATYKNAYFDKDYEILVSQKEKGKYSLYVMAPSMDRLYKDVGFSLTEKTSNQFSEKLIEAKQKYTDWVSTAVKNNVTELTKEMNIEHTVDGFFSTSQGWKFDSYVTLSFEFKILEGKYLLLIRSDKLVDGRNEFIDHDGFIMVFSKNSEIDTFLKLISEESITEFNNKPKKTDLFN